MSIRKQFTAMPSSWNWRAQSTVRRSSATFEMPYDMRPRWGYKAATDDTFTIAPPDLDRCGCAARIAVNGHRG